MQNMIKQIVEMDQKAQQLTESAQQEKLTSEKTLSVMREKLRQDYLERARRRIALNEPREEAAAEEKWNDTYERLQKISQRLDRSYAENGELWVKALIDRVLEK